MKGGIERYLLVLVCLTLLTPYTYTCRERLEVLVTCYCTARVLAWPEAVQCTVPSSVAAFQPTLLEQIWDLMVKKTEENTYIQTISTLMDAAFQSTSQQAFTRFSFSSGHPPQLLILWTSTSPSSQKFGSHKRINSSSQSFYYWGTQRTEQQAHCAHKFYCQFHATTRISMARYMLIV